MCLWCVKSKVKSPSKSSWRYTSESKYSGKCRKSVVYINKTAIMLPCTILACNNYHYSQQFPSLCWMLYAPGNTPTGSRLTDNFPGLGTGCAVPPSPQMFLGTFNWPVYGVYSIWDIQAKTGMINNAAAVRANSKLVSKICSGLCQVLSPSISW